MTEPFFVEHIGRRFCMAAASFKTRDAAVANAEQTAHEAMRTRVYDCSAGPVGRVIWSTDPSEVQP